MLSRSKFLGLLNDDVEFSFNRSPNLTTLTSVDESIST